MRRRAMQLIFAIGLLLTLAAGTLLIRAWWHPTSRAIGQEWTSREGTVRFVTIDSTTEWLGLYWGSYEPVVPPSAFVFRLSVDELPSEVFTMPAPEPPPSWWERIGFGAGYDPFNGTGITAPTWFAVGAPAAMTLAVLVPLLRDRRRYNQRTRGQCESCGYDLRGTAHERCPECGHLVPSASHGEPSALSKMK